MEQNTEWTFEGKSERDFIISPVGNAGNRTRYQSGTYDSTCERGRYAKLSGTAIISNYYRLR